MIVPFPPTERGGQVIGRPVFLRNIGLSHFFLWQYNTMVV